MTDTERRSEDLQGFGRNLPDLRPALSKLEQEQTVWRIWRKDHTVWRPSAEGVAARLGWLSVTDTMRDEIPDLGAFAEEVRQAGFRHVVLLGMGGSSLGAQVLNQTRPVASVGHPQLIVLDSTVPAWVQSVTDSIDPAATLFLVSSKSGGTIEPNTLYRHFRRLVANVVGEDEAGLRFVAITDSGTSLEGLAREDGFRRVFLNPTDIGGRYSVLTDFGLVSAALTGVDIAGLLDDADGMREACGPDASVRENPGALLGAVMATLASEGQDKLTLVTSPSLESFGLWAEQLLAESLGKEGKGIIPIAGEPLVPPNSYGDDRLFVYLRAANDDNTAADAFVDRIESSGRPSVRLHTRDLSALGGEFFRWEFATALAGAILEVNPFDQPNVEAAKEMTDAVLRGHTRSTPTDKDTVEALMTTLSEIRPGDYVAIMAFVQETPEVDEALRALRSGIMSKYRVATTSGYGPRFLHSTGQLHKGGPNSGVFLQLTADHPEDVAVPGAPYTFGELADAQALGDYRALLASDRRVVRVDLGREIVSGIRGLTDGLER